MITEERLRQTFSEGGAQEIYQEVKASGDFLGFAHRYAFNQDYRVARSICQVSVPWQPKEYLPGICPLAAYLILRHTQA